MLEYKRLTGERITYAGLSELCGIPHTTLAAIGSRLAYNTTLANIDLICEALHLDVCDLLERRPDLDTKKPKGKKKLPKRAVATGRTKKR